jgi:hypothetical protein
MSVHDSPLPLDDADFAPVETALQTAYDELERLARSLQDVVSAYNEGTTPHPLPTYEDVGRLYLFAELVRDGSAAQIIDRANDLLELLPTFDNMMILNAPKAE